MDDGSIRARCLGHPEFPLILKRFFFFFFFLTTLLQHSCSLWIENTKIIFPARTCYFNTVSKAPVDWVVCIPWRFVALWVSLLCNRKWGHWVDLLKMVVFYLVLSKEIYYFTMRSTEKLQGMKYCEISSDCSYSSTHITWNILE